MTYFRFHLVFSFPIVLLLMMVPSGRAWTGEETVWTLVVLGLVFLFTIPWDNYAAWKGIWGFPPDKYSFKIGYLPIEEYLFFLLQSLVVILFLNHLIPWQSASSLPGAGDWLRTVPGQALPAFALALWIATGLLLRKKVTPRFHYTWHLFYWFGPVLLIQWLIGWPVLAPRLPLLLLSAAAVGTWFSAADWVAVRCGLWYFDPRQITGHKFPGGLPWEEVAFFYVTSLLVAQSYLLFLPETLR